MINAATILTELQLFTFTTVMSKKGYSEQHACLCADAMFTCLYQNFKTRQLYIPSPAGAERKELYRAIFDDFDGHNHHTLAIKYKRSLQNIYKVINLMRSEHIRDKQIPMFALDEDKDSRAASIYVIEEYLPSLFVSKGLSDDDAVDMAHKISQHACERYPGISVTMPESLGKARKSKTKHQTDLFT